MNTFLKIVLIVAASLMVVGGIIIGIVVARDGEFWHAWQDSGDAVAFTKQFDAGEIYNLDIESGAHAVEIVSAEDGQITIQGQNNARRYYDVEKVGNTLRIYYRSRARNIFAQWFHWGDWGSGTLRIALPPDMPLEAVRISSVSGDISWNSHPASMKSCTLESVSGSVQIRDLTTEASLSIESVSGRIVASHCRVGGDMRLDNTSGSINVASAEVDGNLRAACVSGKISITDMQAADITTDNLSGRTELQALSFTSIHCESVSGALHVSVPDAEYQVRFDTVSGNVNSAFGNSDATALRISLETVSGSITLARD